MNPLFSRRPKAGLLLLTAEWFVQIGATSGSFAGLPGKLSEDAACIEAALRPELDLVSPGVLSSVEQVSETIGRFRQEGVDLVIACQVTWGEDRLILEAARNLPELPLLLWCYSPFQRLPQPVAMPEMLRASGPVGALQASGALKRLGYRYGVAFGSFVDPTTIRRIVAFSKAARLVKDLRKAVIGVLPYRCDQMTGTYVDEFRLRKELGPELKYISTHDYLDVCQAVSPRRVEVFIEELRHTYPTSPALTALGLERAARVSLGLADLARLRRLDAVAIEDVGEELHKVVGLRPCLSTPELFDQAVVSMEAEIGGAVALLAFKALSGLPPMYTEIFTYDQAENALLMGHAGIHDITLAEDPSEVLLEPDGEYVQSEPDSAWMRFQVRSGQVTLLSIFCDVERFKLVISSGEVMPGPPRLLGSPHAMVKIATPLPEFFDKCLHTGMTQHWALVHADLLPELLALAEIIGLEALVV